MLSQEDLQAISQIVRSEIAPVKDDVQTLNCRVESLENRMDNLESSLEEVRTSTNYLVDWADRVEHVVGISFTHLAESGGYKV